ncbi:hypothetical protein AAFF_G00090100 [Aldrovandia affinis]|uniref:SCAN box domain-containing protein n=1 Tax=Aldrovandia affinis TaxID=143900 RepID=A0AAD7WCC9_9TELE|nr:hypothetical protein AAFF_G00090100 [Aldrovandia affinis]
MHPEIHSKEEIGETVILEQLLKVLPHDMRVWIKEHEPKNGVTAAQLVGQYHNAHRGTPPGPQRQPSYHSNLTRGREIRDNRDKPDKGKATQVYHVNLLKEWKERSVESIASEEKTMKTALIVRRIEEEDEDVDLSNLIQPQGAELL